MRVTKPKIVGLSVGLAVLGTALIATLAYFLTRKPAASCAPCTPCTPCKCVAESVDKWQEQM